VCNSEDLELVIDLGHQPLCDSLLRADQLNQPETNYPLRLVRCRVCSLAQLDYVVPGEIVFHRNYPYRAGITQEVVDHHRESAAETVKRYGLTKDSLVVDIGSNDGTLLSAFKAHGIGSSASSPPTLPISPMLMGSRRLRVPSLNPWPVRYNVTTEMRL
jgi:hypothetical protein